MTETIGRLGSKLSVGTMKNKEIDIPGKEFDLTGHEGERVRIHIGEDNNLTVETRAKQNILVCELDVPEKEWEHIDTGEMDDFGEPIIESKVKTLDITKVSMKEHIKEVQKI